jgi:glycosyltransferase involved in cell wall biosynthesis
MAVIGQKLAEKHTCKTIFDMRGFWANERAEGGIWNLKNPIYSNLFSKMLRREKNLLLSSHAVVTLTHAAKNYIIHSFSGVNASKISVIPCSVDMNLFNPSAVSHIRNELVSKWNLQNKKILCYAGSLGTWYLLHEMMEFFSVLQKKYPQFVFLLLTRDTHYNISELEQKYNLNPGSVIIHAASRKEMPAALSLANAGLFFIRPTFSKKGSSPTKLAEFLAMGIPVISNKGIGDMDQQFAENNIGYLLNQFHHSNYQQAVNNFDSLLNTEKSSIINFAKNHYNLNQAINSYEQIYKELLELTGLE